MKIAYISSSTIPSRTANSIHVMKMCQAFARNGHDVMLIAPDKSSDKETGVDDVFAFYGIERCFEIIKPPRRLPFWRQGMRKQLPVKSRKYVYGLLAGEKAQRLEPDIVYGRNLVGCYFAAKSNNLPVIYEAHEPVNKKRDKDEEIFRELIQSPHLQNMVVITESLKSYYQNNYPSLDGKLKVAPDGADPFPANISSIDLPGTVERLQVGYVGHLYPGKGMGMISRLSSSCKWANFHVVGGKEKDVEFWENECADAANIKFHGYVPHSTVPEYLAAFDVVLLPNQPEVAPHGGGDNIGQWTSPLKAFEYMAARKAIVASDLPVLREVLTDEHNALLCKPDDVSAWANALKRLKDDKELRDRLGETAQQKFLENYTWLARAKKVIE